MAGPRPRQVFIVPHTHWDREWYQPFQSFRLKLVDLLDDLLPRLEADPAYAHFMLDGQMAAVDDYLAVRPEAEQRIRDLVASGRVGVGPWQVLMDEFLVSGETIVRDLQQGLRGASAFGGAMEVGYLPDMFGHIAQMPQILRQFGMGDAVVWRGVPAAVDRSSFTWEALDGSTVRAEYLPDGYWNGQKTPHDAAGLVERIRRFEQRWGDLLHGPILWMNGMDHELPQPWLGRVVAEANALQRDYELQVTSLPAYLAAAARADEDGPPRPGWRGELRSGARANLLMGVASNRVDVHQAGAAAERWLERVAEPAAALFRPADRWPGAVLDVAWNEVVRNAAHDSSCACSADEVCEAVLVRYAEARHVAEGVAARAAGDLAGALASPGEVVVNTTARSRPALIETRLWGGDPWPGTQQLGRRGGRRTMGPLALASLVELVVQAIENAPALDDGDLVDVPGEPLQVVLRPGAPEVRPDGADEDVTAGLSGRELVARLARRRDADDGTGLGELVIETPPAQKVLGYVPQVPGFGWSRWEPAPLPVDPVVVGLAEDGTTTLANGLVHVAIDPRTATFALDGHAGLARLVDDGDVGDTYNWCPPDEQTVVDRPATGSVVVRTVEEGPIRARVEVRATYALPERAELPARRVGQVEVEVVTTVEVRAGSRLVWVTHELDNRAEDHRLRAWFPLPRPTARATAECAFGVVTRGLHAEGGPTESPVPTRPMRRFACAGGLTVVQDGLLEHELVDVVPSTDADLAAGDAPAAGDGGEREVARALALTLLRCVGAISRGPMATRALPAGPTTPTPAAQLPGRRTFRYALAAGDDPAAAYDLADEAFTPLLVARAAGGGALPDTGHALEVRGAQVSAVRHEHGSLVVRVHNPTDAETVVELPGRHGWLVDLRGRALAPFDGSFRLRPWGIATATLDRPASDPTGAQGAAPPTA